MVRRIATAVRLPVSADVEAAYGTTIEAAAETARGVVAAGAVGMNFEDTDDDGKLLPLARQVERIRAARNAADDAGVPIVINARTDAFAMSDLRGDERIGEAVRRANAYLEAGGDCAFVPFITDREVIARLVREIRGPVNILATPGAPPIGELERIGVRRVSVGGGLARAAYGRARRVALELKERGTYETLAEGAVTYAEMQRLLGA